MKKKFLIGIGIIILIIIICLIKNKREQKIADINQNNEKIFYTDICYDEDTGEYYIYDENTGEEITRNRDKESLYIYSSDSDYNPRTPSSD